MNTVYVVKFDSRSATLYNQNGCFIRRYSARAGKTIAAASVNNAGNDSLVTINYTDGHADIYLWTGKLCRQF